MTSSVAMLFLSVQVTALLLTPGTRWYDALLAIGAGLSVLYLLLAVASGMRRERGKGLFGVIDRGGLFRAGLLITIVALIMFVRNGVVFWLSVAAFVILMGLSVVKGRPT